MTSRVYQNNRSVQKAVTGYHSDSYGYGHHHVMTLSF